MIHCLKKPDAIEVTPVDSTRESKGISSLAKDFTIFGISTLGVGVLISVIELVAHTGISAIFIGAISSVLATVGPFLSVAAATICSFLTAPVGVIILASLVVIAAVIVVIICVIAAKSDFQTQAANYLTTINESKVKLAEFLRKAARDGNIKDLVLFAENNDTDIFFDEDKGQSVMSLLIKQQVPDFLYLLNNDMFDGNNPTHRMIYETAIQFDDKGYASDQTLIFFTHLAMVNYDFAKACLQQGLTEDQQKAMRDDDDAISFILQYDCQTVFADALTKNNSKCNAKCAEVIEKQFPR